MSAAEIKEIGNIIVPLGFFLLMAWIAYYSGSDE